MSAADAARLRLFQLVSPALPVGAFSYSEGLEVLLQAGRLAGPEPLEQWLRAELRQGAVAVEAAALSELGAAWRHCRATAEAEPLLQLDGWLLAQREAAELRAQQRQTGQSLLQLLSDLGWALPEAVAPGRLAWPAAFAWAGLCLELGSPQLEEAYLYGWAANQKIGRAHV